MRSTHLVFAAVLAASAVLCSPAARADVLLGEPWEPGIVEGVQKQELERRERAPDAILRQARLAAARRSDPTTRIVRLYLLARAYGIAGDPGSAMSTYREVLRDAPRCYFAFHDLAMLQIGAQRPDTAGAERNLRQAVQIHPRFVTGYRKLASLLLSADRAPEAMSVLRRIVDLEPADLQARFLLARTLLAGGQLDQAEREVAMLLRREPKNAAFRDLKARIWLLRNRFDDAKRVWREIAIENPSVPDPLSGYLQCLEAARVAGGQPSIEEYLWALEGLYRLERDPARKKKLKDDIERMRRSQDAPTPAPEQPEGRLPTDAELVTILADANAERRIQLLRWVYSRSEPPEARLMEAIARHVGPQRERAPTVRTWALRVLGRFGAVRIIGLVRHSLADPDADVRPVAVDTLVDLARVSDSAKGASFLIVGPAGLAPDPRLGSAARAAAYELGGGSEPPDLETEAARLAAYRAWWQGPAARESRIQALERFGELQDPVPEDVLLSYLGASDRFEAETAWRALATEAARLLAAERTIRREGTPPVQVPLVTGARRSWLQQLPPYVSGALGGDDAVALRGRLEQWAQARSR